MTKKWIYYTSPAGRNKIQDELRDAKLSKYEVAKLQLLMERLAEGRTMPQDVKALRVARTAVTRTYRAGIVNKRYRKFAGGREQVDISLAELAGFADDDPELVAARADVSAYANLIESLVELRHRRRMTQADVAEVMSTTQSVVSHFERLGGDARFSTVQRYARAVGAQLHWHTDVDDEDAPTLPRTRRPAVAARAHR